MRNKYSYLINLIFPSFIFGSVTGVLTAITVTFYKLCAKRIIFLSEECYKYMRECFYLIPVAVIALFGIALFLEYIYKKLPNLCGGGIPTSIGILRGLIGFNWLKNFIGTFFLSLLSFLIGVPLGNEGPSVQMGTAIGRGNVSFLSEKHKAWNRYSMTGGACAGFATATGAPISGIMFAIEEAHQRISPMIIMVSYTSVMFSFITTEFLSELFNIDIRLFPKMELTVIGLKEIWLPILIALIMGLFAVLFLQYYELINRFFNKKLKIIPRKYKIFLIFVITLILGLCSYSFISTGHELMVSLFDKTIPIYILLLLLILRSTLTVSANSNGITGGMFVPILVLGAVLSAIIGELLEQITELSPDYYTLILALGITACISGMMKMPLTAILFSIEALSCYDNILSVILVSAITFIITEIFGTKSINESVLENKMKGLNNNRKLNVIDTFVTVQRGAFAIGKQIRDIFWPANLFVLSLRHNERQSAQVDEHGGKIIKQGDILHIRYSTFDENETRHELTAIVGQQEYEENQIDII